MRRWAYFLVAATAAILTNAGPAGAETKLKMLYTAVTGFSSAYLAQEAGFFKKRGIDMEFVLTASSGNNVTPAPAATICRRVSRLVARKSCFSSAPTRLQSASA